jgi:hypothetical protein
LYNTDSKLDNEEEGVSTTMERNSKARASYFKHRKEMLDKSLSFVLRVTVTMKNIGKVVSKYDKDESKYDDAYSGNHIVIFEN